MAKLFIGALLSLLLLLPAPSMAEAQAAAQPPADSVSTAKVVAIGVGAVLGAVAAEAVVFGDSATLVGGLVGAVIATWWYDASGGYGATRASLRPSATTAAYE
jgi:hypothetical protein